tara:strand:+ start:1801 stop:2079 length:279 start_codon:yes stop_codon:yes gene_type:complete
MRPYNLKDYEILTALRFFTYHMPLEQRGQLMREFPIIYNKLMESDIQIAVSRERWDSLCMLAKTVSTKEGGLPLNPSISELHALNELLENDE